jgi:N-acetylneuraminic acid mutarotase
MTARARARAATADHLFLLGGREIGGATAMRTDMWAASFASGTWAQASIPAARGNSAAVTWDRYLYLLGGRDDAGDGNREVWVTRVDTAGRPGSWTPTEPLCAGRYGHAAVAANGHLYAFGGRSGNVSVTTTSCFTTIDPATGDLQPWAETTPLPIPLRNPAVVATDDFVYLLGGCTDTSSGGTACSNGANATPDVFAAAVLADGRLGEWVHVSTLPDAWIDRGATIYDGRIYVVGGANDNVATDRVWTALLGYGGCVGDWREATPAHVAGSSTRAHRRPGVAAAGGRLYVFQHDDYVSETISAPLQ